MPTRDRYPMPSAADAAVFLLLVLIGVAGRWGQPTWACTPIAAVTLLAGAYFTRVGVAMLVPFTALAITDLGLRSHQNLGVMLTVYAAMMAPAVLGRFLRRGQASPAAWAGRIGAASLAPATLFFITTNFAVWLFQSNYPSSLAGLAECYANAIPFYRNMIAGDFAYTTLLFAVAALAGQGLLSSSGRGALKPAEVPVADK